MSKRDSKLKLSVWLSLFAKSLNMGVNFLLVPLLIGFLGKERYGIWVTIYAFVNWFNIFDLGLGQGLKLKLTEAFTLKRNKKIKVLISSAYFFVTIIALVLIVIATISYFFLNWSSTLGINEKYHLETNQALLILTLFFLSIFVLKLIGEIYASLQFPFVQNVVKTIGQLFFLVFVVMLSCNLSSQGSLLFVSVFSILPLFILYLGINIYFFGYKSISLLPRVNLVSKESLRQIVNPGISFFIIQIGCIILYSTDNLIIINLLSSETVADYDVYYKYYSLPFLFYNIYIGSHWSSFIDALSKNDKRWIQKN
jgi:O-antigen/teichoic acid export membrane protein